MTPIIVNGFKREYEIKRKLKSGTTKWDDEMTR